MNYTSMAIEVSISENNEFCVASFGATSSSMFTKMLHVCRDKYHGKFAHNVVTVSKLYKKSWVFDIHLAKAICSDLAKIASEEHTSFHIPSWVNEIECSRGKEFKKYRASIDDNLVKSDWQGEYQKRDVLFAIKQNRAALFIEMGLGKTFIIRTALNHLEAWGKVNRVVVVSPVEGVINIASEFIRFSAQKLSWDDIYIVDTTHRNPFDTPHKLTIMTYRGLIMLHDDFYKKERGVKASKFVKKNYIPWERLGDKLCIILDESQNIKSFGSKTWKIVDKAKDFFDYRYIMSGTPSPKYAIDLWTQMRFLSEDAVPKDYYAFLSTVADVGNRFSRYAVNFYYEDRVKTFLDSINYLVIREKAKGNISLPDVLFVPIRCIMSPKQEKLYQSIANQVLTVIKQEENGRVTMHRLQDKFPYLSIALHDPSVLQDSNLIGSGVNLSIKNQVSDWDISENGKYASVESLLEKYASEGRKTILWSAHPVIIDILCERFSKYHPYKLHGSVVVNKGESVSQRNASLCSAFVNDKESSLLIANYACLSTAVNLVEVTRQIFWDRSWRSDIYIQAIKRSNRIGSTEPLVVNDMIFCNSIEEYQYREIRKRLNFNDSLFEGGKGADDVLDKRDVLELSDVKEILTGKII